MAACAPNWYRGSIAVLANSPGVEILGSEREWGDCYRRLGTMPTVYKISRANYSVYLAHGRRYWPELFILAKSADGTVLDLQGAQMTLIVSPVGGNFRRVPDTTGLLPTHEIDLRGVGTNTLDFRVLDKNQRVVGEEQLAYRIEDVQCFEWDSL